jgi:hypothetical protein
MGQLPPKPTPLPTKSMVPRTGLGGQSLHNCMRSQAEMVFQRRDRRERQQRSGIPVNARFGRGPVGGSQPHVLLSAMPPSATTTGRAPEISLTARLSSAAAGAAALLVRLSCAQNRPSGNSSFAAASRLHRIFDPPTRFIPGNHDVGDSPEIPGSKEPPIDAARRRH